VTFTEHPLFPKLRPFVRIELYSRDGGHKNPRFRINFNPMPTGLHVEAMELETHCVSCGRRINPVRDSARGVYFAATCPLAVNIACSRSSKARDEYKRVRDAVEAP